LTGFLELAAISMVLRAHAVGSGAFSSTSGDFLIL
jgi:hypothetical protein